MLVVGCSAPTDVEPPRGGVVYTYPANDQRDVPLGARVLVSFSDAVDGPAARIVGPDGPVEIASELTGDRKTIAITSSAFAPRTTYDVYAGAETGTPLFRFTTRNDRPLAGQPALVAFNGSDPASPGTFRPIYETSTLSLVFSEPLDPRSFDGTAIALVDAATGTPIPATLLGNGIHAALDPKQPLVAGAPYELRISDQLVDLGGERIAAGNFTFTPVDSLGRGPIQQTFRTRTATDPVASIARTDAVNEMAVVHPLIGEAIASVHPAVLETELGDPLAQGGPIAFRIPKGQRLASAGLDIKLSGAVASGLATGDIWIEMLTDGGGRLYRNPYRSPDTIPDNTYAPLQVDLSFDLAIYATDPTGNAVLAQTALGVQLTGLAIADEGALAIETLGALDIGLLGISSAPTNIVLDLISAPGATREPDVRAPVLLSSLPAADTNVLVTDDGIELVFDEPIDIERARGGGIVLRDTANNVVPAQLELHGSVVVVRPRATLLGNHAYRVEINEVADVAGNLMLPASLSIGTQPFVPTEMPASLVAVLPGAPCSLVDGNSTTAGRCAGGAVADDRYKPFSLAANETITVVFDQPLLAQSVALGAACNTGSVRVERVDEQGSCLDVVSGTLVEHQRDFAFVPDEAWVQGERYRLRLFSGLNTICEPGDLCGADLRPANFDPLAGTKVAGGPDVATYFVGAATTKATTMLVHTGQGDDNRVALKIARTSGLIQQASFTGDDCIPSTPEKEACMFVLGAIPAQLGERRDNCTLPDGSTVATCIPVAMSAQAMYSTSVEMRAGAMGINLTTETGTSVMRVRERADGPLEGYIVERDGKPTMVVALDLYMDAPDMSLPLSQHDMHSKPLSVSLEGPLTFLPDGRISIALRNTTEVPVSVGIDAPLGISGAVHLVIPVGEMKLQLLSPSQRGSLP